MGGCFFSHTFAPLGIAGVATHRVDRAGLFGNRPAGKVVAQVQRRNKCQKTRHRANQPRDLFCQVGPAANVNRPAVAHQRVPVQAARAVGVGHNILTATRELTPRGSRPAAQRVLQFASGRSAVQRNAQRVDNAGLAVAVVGRHAPQSGQVVKIDKIVVTITPDVGKLKVADPQCRHRHALLQAVLAQIHFGDYRRIRDYPRKRPHKLAHGGVNANGGEFRQDVRIHRLNLHAVRPGRQHIPRLQHRLDVLGIAVLAGKINGRAVPPRTTLARYNYGRRIRPQAINVGQTQRCGSVCIWDCIWDCC